MSSLVLKRKVHESGRANINQSLTRHFRCLCIPRCNGATTCITRAKCFSGYQMDLNIPRHSKGCLEQKDNFQDIVCHTKNQIAALKCCSNDLCNENLVADLVTPPPTTPSHTDDQSSSRVQPVNVSLYLSIFIPITILIITIAIVIYIFRRLHRRQTKEMEKTKLQLLDPENIVAHHMGDSTLKDYLNNSCTSGSGSGIPLLTYRTVAHQINLLQCVGSGKYGEVWHGTFLGESIAVKIFSSIDEPSWSRETHIYNTVMLRHENILGYIASDMMSRADHVQFWLITHYHPRGSLYDYLNIHTVDHDLMLKLALSSAAGLVHLHTEIAGKEGKPSIAHRDVKSKNILVMSNGNCCIGDLGLAVMHSDSWERIDIGSNHRVGTARYMAPEVLDETVAVNIFHAFTQVDTYAFGLVLWEIARRCVIAGQAEEYRLPYHDSAPSDPSIDDMRNIVVCDEQRPTFPNRWTSDPVMTAMSKLMTECWYKNGNARLPMLRVKKTLQNINKLCQGRDDVKS